MHHHAHRRARTRTLPPARLRAAPPFVLGGFGRLTLFPNPNDARTGAARGRATRPEGRRVGGIAAGPRQRSRERGSGRAATARARRARGSPGMACAAAARGALVRSGPRSRSAPRKGRRTAAMAAAAPAEAYAGLKTELEEIASLSGIEGLLHWDQASMMPPGAQELRGKQMAALAGVVHARKTSAKLGELIAACGGAEADAAALGEGACEFDAANVRRAHEDYRRASRVPAEMAKREAELSAAGYAAWMKAREENDWPTFSPILKEVRARGALAHAGRVCTRVGAHALTIRTYHHDTVDCARARALRARLAGAARLRRRPERLRAWAHQGEA